MQYKLNIKNSGVELPKELIEAAGGDEFIARIFYNRGYKEPDIVRQMLDESLYTPTTPTEFPHMGHAVDRIIKAAQNGEKVAVYGDYDVDGVTSTVTLVECFKMIGLRVSYHVPDRFTEGYGMNEGVVRDFCSDGISLIVTCDCGISNYDEIKTARSLSADVIVTDHHNIPETLPPANVILNPKLLEEGHRARNISGCGMAYFLCRAILKHYDRENEADEFLDLLALSLVADVVSLNGENRYLLRNALPKLFNSKRTGMKALFSVIEKNVKMENEEDIAFQIAPRINAAGRMDTARLPVELFLAKGLEEAGRMAQKIDELNKERKKLQQEIVKQAYEMVKNGKKNKTILVLFGEFWHHGIIGIAAGKICETFRKPAILLSLKEDGRTVVGSARSTEDINIYELIKECSGKLIKFGGHSAAAGLSLDKDSLNEFTREIETLAEEKYFIDDTVQIDSDMELKIEDIDETLYEKLRRIGPFGEGFQQPVFFSKDVSAITDRKTDKNHHIMVLGGQQDTRIQAVKWFGEKESLEGKNFDIVYSIGKNNFSGDGQLQLTLTHISECTANAKKAFKGEFIDKRGMEINDILTQFDGAQIFFEGISDGAVTKKYCSRSGIRRNRTLILLSPPANTQILKEIIYLSDPEQVVLNFSRLPDYTFRGFVLNLLSVLKYIINRNNGRAFIEELSIKLCVEESIIISALKYLKEAGKIVYYMEPDEIQILVEAANKSATSNIKAVERNLKNALDEKNAYQKFILELEPQKFKEYFK